MLVVVEVTAADIEKGRPAHCHYCPIALAILRACPDLDLVSVGAGVIDLNETESFVAPGAVRSFVRAFDTLAGVSAAHLSRWDMKRLTDEVQPFTFATLR